MNRYKKLFYVLLFSFVLSDVCSYIKLYIENDGIKLENFYFYVTKYNHNGISESMYNLSIIFLMIAGALALLVNLLKKDD